jgi:hypothetical protein
VEPEAIVVRGLGGRAFVRWMVRSVGSVAYLTNTAGAAAMRAGTEPKAMIGFPLGDVYLLPKGLIVSDGEVPNWADLAPRFPE